MSSKIRIENRVLVERKEFFFNGYLIFTKVCFFCITYMKVTRNKPGIGEQPNEDCGGDAGQMSVKWNACEAGRLWTRDAEYE